MILYYSFDREILNEKHFYERNRNIIHGIESQMENELKYLIFIMPIEECVAISTTFRFESSICRRILTRHRAFIEKGYLVQYMREASEYDFREKKQFRYKDAMELCPDYKTAYCNPKIFKEVNDIWMKTVQKETSVGISSRSLFSKEVERTGGKFGIPEEMVKETLKIIDDISDNTFLWEVVDFELKKHKISPSVINHLQIRQEMNKSYLRAFEQQGIYIPSNVITGTGTMGKTAIYDIQRIDTILEMLEIADIIKQLDDDSIIKLRENLNVQNLLEIIREGLSKREDIVSICQRVKKKANFADLIRKILCEGSEIMSNKDQELIRPNTLKLLHLSDLHLMTSEDLENAYFYLKLDLKKALKLDRLHYLIVSGDVCDCPCEEQYHVARRFIEQLILDFDLSPTKVVVVPGNHDCDREISRSAYNEKNGEFSEDKRRERFSTYDEHFYFPIFGKHFPTEYIQQIEQCIDREEKIYIAGFNSSYQIDHLNPNRSEICVKAIQKDSMIQTLEDDYVKLVTWHHPISGEGCIQEKTFLSILAMLGYRACFHGHIHEATKEDCGYDDTHSIKMIGAGSLGAKRRERADGIPLQYNLVEIDTKERELIVHTRKREKEDGIWMADARWGDKSQRPKSYYVVKV